MVKLVLSRSSATAGVTTRLLPRLGWGAIVAGLLLTGCSGQGLPATPLFAGLSRQASDHDREQLLARRIYARYQVGRPEGDLPAYLRSQGMAVDRKVVAGAEDPFAGVARIEQGIGICNRVGLISWRANPAGVLRELNVSYNVEHCL
jgi:hypothetical protein